MENEYTRDKVLEYIKEMRDTTPEEIKFIGVWSLKMLFLSLFRFGLSNPVSKDALLVLKEFLINCKIENDIFSIIRKNIDRMDISEAMDYLYYLDDLSKKTFLYYYDIVFDDMETAIKMNEIYRAKRAKYNFNMLIDEENPLEEVYSLIKKNSQQS